MCYTVADLLFLYSLVNLCGYTESRLNPAFADELQQIARDECSAAGITEAASNLHNACIFMFAGRCNLVNGPNDPCNMAHDTPGGFLVCHHPSKYTDRTRYRLNSSWDVNACWKQYVNFQLWALAFCGFDTPIFKLVQTNALPSAREVLNRMKIRSDELSFLQRASAQQQAAEQAASDRRKAIKKKEKADERRLAKAKKRADDFRQELLSKVQEIIDNQAEVFGNLADSLPVVAAKWSIFFEELNCIRTDVPSFASLRNYIAEQPDDIYLHGFMNKNANGDDVEVSLLLPLLQELLSAANLVKRAASVSNDGKRAKAEQKLREAGRSLGALVEGADIEIKSVAEGLLRQLCDASAVATPPPTASPRGTKGVLAVLSSSETSARALPSTASAARASDSMSVGQPLSTLAVEAEADTGPRGPAMSLSGTATSAGSFLASAMSGPSTTREASALVEYSPASGVVTLPIPNGTSGGVSALSQFAFWAFNVYRSIISGNPDVWDEFEFETCQHADSPTVACCLSEKRRLCSTCAFSHRVMKYRKHELRLICLECETVLDKLWLTNNADTPIVCAACHARDQSLPLEGINAEGMTIQAFFKAAYAGKEGIPTIHPAPLPAMDAAILSTTDGAPLSTLSTTHRAPLVRADAPYESQRPPAAEASHSLGSVNKPSMADTFTPPIRSISGNTNAALLGRVQIANLLIYMVMPLLVLLFEVEFDKKPPCCPRCKVQHKCAELTVECICGWLTSDPAAKDLIGQVQRMSRDDTGPDLIRKRFDPSNLCKFFYVAMNRDMKKIPGVRELIAGRNAYSHLFHMEHTEVLRAKDGIKSGAKKVEEYLRESHYRVADFSVDGKYEELVSSLTDIQIERHLLDHLNHNLRLMGAMVPPIDAPPVVAQTQGACDLLLREEDYDTITLVLLPSGEERGLLREKLDFLRTCLHWNTVVDICVDMKDDGPDALLWKEDDLGSALDGPWKTADQAPHVNDVLYTSAPLDFLTRLGVDGNHLIVLVADHAGASHAKLSALEEVNKTISFSMTQSRFRRVSLALCLGEGSVDSDSAAEPLLQELCKIAQGVASCQVLHVCWPMLTGLVMEQRQAGPLRLLHGVQPNCVRPMASDRWVALESAGVELLTVGCDDVDKEQLQALSSEFVFGRRPAHWSLFASKLTKRRQVQELVTVLEQRASIKLLHGYGEGGSTVARHVAYELRSKFVVTYVTQGLGKAQRDAFKQLLLDAQKLTGLEAFVVIDIADDAGISNEEMLAALGNFVTLTCMHNVVSEKRRRAPPSKTTNSIQDRSHYVEVVLQDLTQEEQRLIYAFFPTAFPPRELQWDGVRLDGVMTDSQLDSRKVATCIENNKPEGLATALKKLKFAMGEDPSKFLDNGTSGSSFWPVEVFEMCGSTLSPAAEVAITQTQVPLLQFGLLNFSPQYAERAQKLVEAMLKRLQGHPEDVRKLKLVVFFSLYAPGTGVPKKLVTDTDNELPPFLRMFCTTYKQRGKPLVEIRIPRLLYMLAEDRVVFGPLDTIKGRPERLLDYVKEELLPLARKSGNHLAEPLHGTFIFNIWHWPLGVSGQQGFGFFLQSVYRFEQDSEYRTCETVSEAVARFFLSLKGNEYTIFMVTNVVRFMCFLASRSIRMSRASSLLDKADVLLDLLLPAPDYDSKISFAQGLVLRKRMEIELTAWIKSRKGNSGALPLTDPTNLADWFVRADQFFSQAFRRSRSSHVHAITARAQLHVRTISMLCKAVGVDTMSSLNQHIRDKPWAQELVDNLSLEHPALTRKRLVEWVSQARTAARFVYADAHTAHSSQQNTENKIGTTMADIERLFGEQQEQTAVNARVARLRHSNLETSKLCWSLVAFGVQLHIRNDDGFETLLEDVVECSTRLAEKAGRVDSRAAWRAQPLALRQKAEAALKGLTAGRALRLHIDDAIERVDVGSAHGLTPYIANMMVHLAAALVEPNEDRISALSRASQMLFGANIINDGAERRNKYQNSGSTRYFLATEPALVDQPLTRFLSVSQSDDLEHLKRVHILAFQSKESEKVDRCLKRARVHLFSGHVADASHLAPSLETDCLPGVRIRFTNKFYGLNFATSDLQLGTAVTFAVALKDRGLWAHVIQPVLSP